MTTDTHVYSHCGTPKITRRWKKLGVGAMWRCTCGKQWWLRPVKTYDYPKGWEWQEVPKS